MGLPATSTSPMTVDEVKEILNISTTTYDTVITNNLYSMAVFANDYTNNGLSYSFIPTMSQYTNLGASSSPTTLMPWLCDKSVVVFSSDEAKIYDEDHDYEINYEDGTLCYLNGSTYGTSTGGYALVHYQFIYPMGGAKIAIAQLLQNSWGTNPNVLSESIGPLSRTYAAGQGLPVAIMNLLRPYRKARFC